MAIVRNGDKIQFNAERRRLDLLISNQERHQRLARWSAPLPKHWRGYPRLYVEPSCSR